MVQSIMRGSCRRPGILCRYTCIEPWAGRYTDPNLSPSKRWSYSPREEVLNSWRERTGARVRSAVDAAPELVVGGELSQTCDDATRRVGNI